MAEWRFGSSLLADNSKSRRVGAGENVGHKQTRTMIGSVCFSCPSSSVAEHVLGKDEVAGSKPVLGSMPRAEKDLVRQRSELFNDKINTK
jgi:hypothetical protein